VGGEVLFSQMKSIVSGILSDFPIERQEQMGIEDYRDQPSL
jgi:hypothetical protein